MRPLSVRSAVLHPIRITWFRGKRFPHGPGRPSTFTSIGCAPSCTKTVRVWVAHEQHLVMRIWCSPPSPACCANCQGLPAVVSCISLQVLPLAGRVSRRRFPHAPHIFARVRREGTDSGARAKADFSTKLFYTEDVNVLYRVLIRTCYCVV